MDSLTCSVHHKLLDVSGMTTLTSLHWAWRGGKRGASNVFPDQVTYPGWSACRKLWVSISRSFSSELPASRWETHNGRGKLPRALSFQAATNPMIIPSINLGEWAGSHLPSFELPHLCQGYFVQNDKHYPLILFCTSHIFPQSLGS